MIPALRQALIAGACAAAIALPATSALAQQVTPLPNAASAQAEGFSPERLAKLDAAMTQAVAAREVGGMVTLLARHGKVVAFHAYGEAAPGRPMTRDTIFRIYSMTKVVTAVAMMALYEEGKWQLDDPVTKFIPEFASLKVAAGTDKDGKLILEAMQRPPTMRELMSHTAGFSYGGTGPAGDIFRTQDPMGADDLHGMVQRLAQVPLLYQPGTSWQYSIAVDIQGYIVEKLSGMKLSDFFRTRIFAPLGMVDTAFYVPAEKYSRFASLYAHDKDGALQATTALMGRPAPDYKTPPKIESGGGGLVSTVDDYARFAEMLANKGALGSARILAPQTIEVMQTNVVPDAVLARPNPYPVFNKGLGWGMGVMTVNDPRLAGRTEGKGTMSWEGAAGTWFWSDTENHVTFVGLIQNSEKAGPNSYNWSTRPLVYQALVTP
ncbi:MAG TPA: serine hydrolase domain-containing protein [Sphingobium sp.]|nr:serine hydrolase domain-containing protein [Sphingobium sp.]